MKASATVITVAAITGVALFFFANNKKTSDDQRPDNRPQPSSTRHKANKTDSSYASLADPAIRWQLQVERIRRIDRSTLTQKDIDTLYGLLEHTPTAHHRKDWYVIANEIMQQLRRFGLDSDRLSESFLAVIRNPKADPVLRDYAVQHLGQWINPQPDFHDAPYEQNPEIIQEVEDSLRSLITDSELTHTSIPGTTLMILADLHQCRESLADDPKVQATRPQPIVNAPLKAWLTKAVSGDLSVPPSLRISAINAASLFQIKDIQPHVRRLAENDATDASLRLTSISALGYLGTEEDKTFLQQIAQSKTKLRFAAQSALEKLNRH